MKFFVEDIVNVFPISATAFGLPSGWFERYSSVLVKPSYLLMVLLLVVSVGIMVLRQFDNANLERKGWSLPLVIVIVGFWPTIVLALKDIVDIFNTFLVQNIFHIEWHGFGFPELGSVRHLFWWSLDSLSRLLPNLVYWIIYAFYFAQFFFLAVLGPFILAKGILFDEVEAFLELVKEILILFLWQTTVVILVGFILPEIVSGQQFSESAGENIYFRSFILGVVMIFVPSMTRKFGNHLGSSMFPSGVLRPMAILGTALMARVGGGALAEVGLGTVHGYRSMHYRGMVMEDMIHDHLANQKMKLLKEENYNLKSELKEEQRSSDEFGNPLANHIRESQRISELSEYQGGPWDAIVHLSKRAKKESGDIENGGPS